SAKILSAVSKHGTVNLYDVKAPYTVLMFWDPDCSHCKAEMPKIEELYKKYKDSGLVVYAVCVEQEYDKWINFIREKNLNWINVIDIYNISEFRKSYDISSTPVIFLLDKDKKIIAKKLNGQSLEQLLEFEFKKN
ncbi:MAG: TlpA family protein disulfide reductase, partial [Bacteroidetes bacterium]|nr:TlpA family protein disulfide reductase [Bacteroidota bacterium]